MRHFRALTAQTPAIVISLIAVVLSLGGGAYAATLSGGRPEAQPSSAGQVRSAAVTFHRLHLINNWGAGPANSGTPSYGAGGGFVYLSGGLFQSTAGSDTFARLPRAARPNRNLFFTVSVNEGVDPGTVGTLLINTNGKMVAYSIPNAGDAQAFTSLAGVVFRRKS